MQKPALQVRFVKNAATSCLDTFTSRTQTFEGNLALADEDFEDFNDEDANNDVEIEELTYSFPIGTSTQVVLAANGADG